MDFENINNAAINGSSAEEITVELVTIGGVQKHSIEEGMTVADFKAKYGLDGMNIVDEDGDVLKNTDTLESDCQLFVSTPKKNG